MPNYTWKGRTRAGKTQEGVLVAENKDAVIAMLRKQQVTVTAVTEKGKEFALPKMGGGITQKEIAVFTRQFSVMIDAGLPLVQCLEILGATAGQPGLSEDPVRGPAGHRIRRDARRFAAQASQGLRRPLLQHGRRRRDGRYSRHHSPAALAVHREDRQAARRGPVGDGLSGRGHPDRDRGRLDHPLEGHPDLRHAVRGPGSAAPAADAHHDHAFEVHRRVVVAAVSA